MKTKKELIKALEILDKLEEDHGFSTRRDIMKRVLRWILEEDIELWT